MAERTGCNTTHIYGMNVDVAVVRSFCDARYPTFLRLALIYLVYR